MSAVCIPPPRSGRATQCLHKGVFTDLMETVPGYRIPSRCKLGFTYYDVRRGEDLVGRAVPSLKLSGRWLELCGFQVGDELAISTEQGSLVLSRRPPAGDCAEADAKVAKPLAAASATQSARGPARSMRASRRRGPARTDAQ
jgi:hypothetical protein